VDEDFEGRAVIGLESRTNSELFEEGALDQRLRGDPRVEGIPSFVLFRRRVLL